MQLAGGQAAEECLCLGEGGVGVGAGHERRDRRRLLVLAAVAAQPAQAVVEAAAVGRRAEEGAQDAGGAGCNETEVFIGDVVGVGGDICGSPCDEEHAKSQESEATHKPKTPERLAWLHGAAPAAEQRGAQAGGCGEEQHH